MLVVIQLNLSLQLECNDIVVAPDLLAQLDLSDNETVCTDRGFDSDTFRRLIQSKQSKANIPYKKNREHLNVGTDWYLYKIRHLVENAFARLKAFFVRGNTVR